MTGPGWIAAESCSGVCTTLSGATLFRVGCVDTSCLVAIAFGERGAASVLRRLEKLDYLVASNVLEGELCAAFAREATPFDDSMTAGMTWILPDRSLQPEIEQTIAAGYLRGADLWHVACALFLVNDPREIAFLTRDERQRSVAKALGFKT